MDLVKKYKPSRLIDVQGHPKMVQWMISQVGSPQPSSVLLSGPSGVGKTLSGHLYAKASSCDAPMVGEACGGCPSCASFDKRGIASDVRTYQCGERSTVAEILELVELARITPNTAKRRVIALDEMHNLSGRAMDALLAITDQVPHWTTFICMTSKLERIPDSIRTRFRCFELSPFNPAESFAFLANVCGRENIEFEERALSLVAHVVPGAPRALLRALDRLCSLGLKISQQNVRDEFGLNVLRSLEDIVEAALRNDTVSAIKVISDWRGSSEQKLQLLQMLFGRIYFEHSLRIILDDPVLDGFDAGVANALAKRVMQCSARLDVPDTTTWLNLVDLLNPRDRVTDTQLKTTVAQLGVLLEDFVPVPTRRQQRPSKRLKVLNPHAELSLDGRYRSWESAKAVWRSASFLTQQYGETFNVRAVLYCPTEDLSEVADATSNFTRRLHMRLQEWSCAPDIGFHWCWTRERGPGGLTSRLALAVPHSLQTQAASWVRSRFAKLDSNGFSVVWRARNARENKVRFHWNTVRHLIRSLDQGVTSRSKGMEIVALVDLLGVPPKFRGALAVRGGRGGGTSQSLGPQQIRTAAKEMPLLSAIDDRAWDFVDSGWEIQEHLDRQHESERRREAERVMRDKLGASGHFALARLDVELAALRRAQSRDPRDRARSWYGWWQRGSEVERCRLTSVTRIGKSRTSRA